MGHRSVNPGPVVHWGIVLGCAAGLLYAIIWIIIAS